MSEERLQILKMLAAEKITVDEAERLLKALGEEKSEQKTSDSDERHSRRSSDDDDIRGRRDKSTKAKYLYISVKPKDGGKGKDKVNIRVPLGILRAGLKLGSMLPDSARVQVDKALGEKGINLTGMDEASFEEFIKSLTDMNISVDDDNEKVDIYCG